MAPSELDLPPESAAPTSRSRRLRMALFLSVPVCLVLGGIYMWLTGGRYISTENAYVKRDMVSVSADVSGKVTAVGVKENQRVQAGQVLFTIDDEPYRIKLAEAEAELANERLKVEQMRASYREHQAAVVNAQQNVRYQQTEFERRRKLRVSGYAAEADYDKAFRALESARQSLATEQQGLQSALAALGGHPDVNIERHPQVLQAKAKRDSAQLNLARTAVRAPITGTISQSNKIIPGHYMIAGAPALSLVQRENSWVEANFKETDLTHMVVGQSATIHFDVFPGREFKARVLSIGAATGSEFSLLPPQNASGNWVKVVQRIPVRLHVEDQNADDILQAGLSAKVTVDTGYSRFSDATAAPRAADSDKLKN
ncbi:HlyD family secretion protein [Govanella unica]|uniref:HlyD family secretion protein n=1 Tax=Govanella unica TaxID=2975056 RepID=A0A9X3Z7A9_9PROT|nr:HlyD family secretion protein [Govania unica]MDA5194055.1 HlyD family secretion protein [Govania unica]